MKAEFSEYEGSFGLELVPETTEEILRAIRLGLVGKSGARTYISFVKDGARINVTFHKHKRKGNYIRK